MNAILNTIWFILIPLCLGFVTRSEYNFLYIVVLNKKYVPHQMQTRICAAIELVEESYFLLPKNCFDDPMKARNKDFKVAFIKKKRLKFKPLIYEPFGLIWETYSEYVLLERSPEGDFVVETESIRSIRSSFLSNPMEEIKEERSKRRKPCMNKKKTSFESFPRSDYRVKRFVEQFRKIPTLIDEEKLPPRVLLSAPNNPLFTDCFILGWGTFFSNHSYLMQLEGLERRKNCVSSIKPVVQTAGTGNLYGEIWFDREKGQKYVDDLGSPMLCKVKGQENLEVVIGMFMGGNRSLNHVSDTYRSFIGEFHYFTRWALGTNVSVTGDPSSWTLWPRKYLSKTKSRGTTLNFRFEFSIIPLLILLSGLCFSSFYIILIDLT